MFPVAAPDTQLFLWYLNQQSHRKKFKQPSKTINLEDREL